MGTASHTLWCDCEPARHSGARLRADLNTTAQCQRSMRWLVNNHKLEFVKEAKDLGISIACNLKPVIPKDIPTATSLVTLWYYTTRRRSVKTESVLR